MDYEKLFPGRFLKAADFDGKDVNLTIIRVRQEDLPQERGGEKSKPILVFKETKKELVLNKTNAQPIAAMFGRDTDAWLGHRVTFYPAEIQSDIADIAIRVKGSPELAAPIKYTLKLPRRSPRELTLVPTRSPASAPRTGTGRAAATGRAPSAPPPAPTPDTNTPPADPAEPVPTAAELDAERARPRETEDIPF